jgi:hypothetical protein
MGGHNMGIKVTKNHPSDIVCDYPCLKIHRTTKNIVLFLGLNRGILLTDGMPRYEINWEEIDFRVYTGVLTLENILT